MRFIVISGLDGCGKTTVIAELQRTLTNAGVETHYQWLRHNHFLVRPLHAFSRLVGLSNRSKLADKVVWRHEFFKSRWFCSLYLLVTYVDSWLGAARLRWQYRKGDSGIVVCDRWTLDTLVDLAVKFRQRELITSPWHDRFTKMQPPGTMQFVLDRDVGWLLQSRTENQTDPEFPYRCEMYAKALDDPSVIKIDNNASIKHAVQQLLAHILPSQSEAVLNEGG